MPERNSTDTRNRIPNSSESETETTEDEDQVNIAEGTCEECGGEITTDHSAGELHCEDCGLVIDDQLIDYGPEWRAYSSSERNEKSRTGAPLTELRHDRGLSTNIDWKNKDAYGRQLSARKRKQMQRLRKWDHRAKRDSGSNNIAYANGEIKRMGAGLGIPRDIQETAASLYRQAHNNELVPGRSIEGMASASLYIALRVHNEPRSLDEVTEVARIDRKPLQRAYRYISRELDIPLKPADPVKYVPRFATKLGVSQTIVKTAEDLLREVTNTHHVSGNDPTVLAAGALYAAALLEGTLLTQSSVKNASDVTEVSIRNNYGMFLVQSPDTPITEEDVENASTPVDLAETIHDSVTYLNKDEQSTTTPDEDSNDDPHSTSASTTEDNDHSTEQDPQASDAACTDETESDSRSERGSSKDTPAQHFSCQECPCVFQSFHGLSVHLGHKHPDHEKRDSDTYAVDPESNPVLTMTDLRSEP